jgi:hypothetical protein
MLGITRLSLPSAVRRCRSQAVGLVYTGGHWLGCNISCAHALASTTVSVPGMDLRGQLVTG